MPLLNAIRMADRMKLLQDPRVLCMDIFLFSKFNFTMFHNTFILQYFAILTNLCMIAAISRYVGSSPWHAIWILNAIFSVGKMVRWNARVFLSLAIFRNILQLLIDFVKCNELKCRKASFALLSKSQIIRGPFALSFKTVPLAWHSIYSLVCNISLLLTFVCKSMHTNIWVTIS